MMSCPVTISPFPVLKQVSHQALEVDMPAHIHTHRVINGEYLSKVRHPLRTPATLEPDTDPDTGDAVYEVESILTHRKRGRHLQYLIKWAGFPDHDATWEPEDNLVGSHDLLSLYKHEHQLDTHI